MSESDMQFAGRKHFCVNTQSWVYADGTGHLPDEMRTDVMNQFVGSRYDSVNALMTFFQWKDRISNND